MKKHIKLLCGTVLTVAALLSLAACGGKEQASETASSSSAEPTVEQVYHITQRLGNGANDAIDPVAGQNHGRFSTYILYRPLLKNDPVSGEIKPDLAEKWEVSKDELTYTLDMKDGLKWSDGDDLTAEDVVFTIETLLKASIVDGIFPENFLKIEGAKAFQDGTADSISGITVKDDIITIKLTEKTGLFTDILAQTLVLPEHKLDSADPLEIHNNDFWKNPVTSGMFKVKEISAGNYIEYEQNENYEGTKPKITKVISTFLNDPVVAMQDGQSYSHTATKLDEIEALNAMSGITKFDVDTLYYRYFILNLTGHLGEGNSALADKKVREALLYAIDRETLANSIFKGTVKVNNTGVPTDAPEYDKKANTYKFDPEKAKKMLKDAGFDFSKTFKVTHYHTDPVTTNLIAAIAQQLKEVGINVETFAITADASAMLYQTRDYDMALAGFSSFAYENWYGHYSSSSPTFGVVLNKDTSFDALNAKLASTSDEKERAKILDELQKLEQEKLFKLPMFTSTAYTYINTDKVQVPKDLKFGNPWYYNDLHFEDWSIK